MIKQIYIVFILLILALSLKAQNGDCSTSTVTACNGNPTFPFTTNTSANPWGNVQDLPSGNTISNPSTNPSSSNSGCLLSGESSGGATWVQINVAAAGTLEFVINQFGYTDWAMWPYNATACADIIGNTLPPVACNWNASSSGGTGIGPVPAGGNPNNFEPTMNVTAGQSFIICVTNFSNVNATVNMTFGGTANLTCIPFSASNSQSICPGKTATLTATSNLSSPSYTWNPGNFNTPTINVSPASTTVYTVTVAGTNTVNSTFTTQVSTSTVTVHSLPVLSMNINSLVCPNSAINLSASPGFTSYAWSGPPSYSQNTATGAATILNANATMMGNYSVIATTAQGCTVQATNTVGLIPTSPVTVTPIINVCQGGTVNLVASAIGASSYQWTGPLGYTSAAQNPTITNIAPNQNGNYTVVASFVSGTSTCTTNNITNVVVTSATTVALNPLSSICNNGTINLTAPNGGNVYAWTGPSSFSSSQQNPAIANANVANNGVYSLSVTTNGCINTGTVQVIVYPNLNFVTLPIGTTLCVGKTSIMSVSGTGGSGSYNYLWNPTTGLSSPNSATTSVLGVSSTQYTVTLSDANCPVTLTPSVAVTVTVNPTPVITFSTSDARGCESFTTDLISSSIPQATNTVWRFTNNLFYNGANSSSYTFPTHGTYGATLTVTDINGCVDSVKNNAFVMVDPKPIADFNWTPSNPTILINEITFQDQSTVGLPMTNWYWDFGDVFVTDQFDTSYVQNPIHLYNNVYTYAVNLTVTNSFGCKDSITKLMPLEDEFAIYIPNTFTPTKADGKNDLFFVSGMGFVEEGFEMVILDRWGEQIFKTNDSRKGWDGSVKGGVLAKQDVYIYKIKLKDFKLREKEFVGHITLL